MKKSIAFVLTFLMVSAAGFAGVGSSALSVEDEVALLDAGSFEFTTQFGPGPCGFSARCDTGLPLGAQCNAGYPITCYCRSLTKNGCQP